MGRVAGGNGSNILGGVACHRGCNIDSDVYREVYMLAMVAEDKRGRAEI